MPPPQPLGPRRGALASQRSFFASCSTQRNDVFTQPKPRPTCRCLSVGLLKLFFFTFPTPGRRASLLKSFRFSFPCRERLPESGCPSSRPGIYPDQGPAPQARGDKAGGRRRASAHASPPQAAGQRRAGQAPAPSPPPPHRGAAGGAAAPLASTMLAPCAVARRRRGGAAACPALRGPPGSSPQPPSPGVGAAAPAGRGGDPGPGRMGRPRGRREERRGGGARGARQRARP